MFATLHVAITRALHEPLVYRFGITLFHFLWQGAALALLAALLMAALRRRTPQARYAVATLLLALMAVCPVVTFLANPSTEIFSSTTTEPSPGEHLAKVEKHRIQALAGAIVGSSRETSANSSPRHSGSYWNVIASVNDWVMSQLPRFVAAWFLGVCLFSVRLIAGLGSVAWIRRHGNKEVPAWVLEQVEDLKHRLGMTGAVRILETSLSKVPSVIGWLQPLVLLPAGIITGLTVDELRSVLAHELAHIRRRDYLVNVLQNIVESVLFYHPAVWWLSSRIRQEREHCCDDLAIAACGDRVVYARTLATMGLLRSRAPAMSPAATGGSLVCRVRRVLGRPEPHSSAGAWPMGFLILIMSLGVLTSATSPTVGNVAPQHRQTSTEKTPAKQTASDQTEPKQAALPQKAVADTTVQQKAASEVVVPEQGIVGIVVDPFGNPAVGARVALATPSNEIYVDGDTIYYADDAATLDRSVVTTDANGKFRLPSETDPAVLVVVHETGYAESKVATPQQTKVHPIKVQLDSWGRVEGSIEGEREPGVANFWIGSHTGTSTDAVKIHRFQAVATDELGRFVVDHIPAGHGTSQRSMPNRNDKGSHAISGLNVAFEVSAGETTRLTFGTPGQTVRGKLTLPEGIASDGVWLRVAPKAPHFGFAGDEELWQSYGRFKMSAEGKPYFRDVVRISEDGSFRIDSLPPGEYQVSMNASNEAVTDESVPRPTKTGIFRVNISPLRADHGKILDVGQIGFDAGGKFFPASK